MKNEELMTPHDASKIANVSAATIRLWADQGKLATIRTAGGMRLFKRGEVEAVVRKRQESLAVVKR